jgi:hypothetical protein
MDKMDAFLSEHRFKNHSFGINCLSIHRSEPILNHLEAIESGLAYSSPA